MGYGDMGFVGVSWLPVDVVGILDIAYVGLLAVDVVGIQDVVAKSTGSQNPHNMVKATINALENLMSPRSVAAKRGKKVSDIVGRRDGAQARD